MAELARYVGGVTACPPLLELHGENEGSHGQIEAVVAYISISEVYQRQKIRCCLIIVAAMWVLWCDCLYVGYIGD